MGSNIIEFFGYSPHDMSDEAKSHRKEKKCPFLKETCTKNLSDGAVSGACTLQPVRGGPVICCPIRLYAQDYKALNDVAKLAFGDNIFLIAGHMARTTSTPAGKTKVAVFGKRWGKELRLPKRGASGAYFVDWVLAKLDNDNNLVEFVAVEVQSIDTTGNYQEERITYLANRPFEGTSSAGFNWENVNKRILPQLIYKGHTLRRERKCEKGLFFVCPTPVYDKIRERLGGNLLSYRFQPGSLSFLWYDISLAIEPGKIRPLSQMGAFTTTVDQVALAFTSPSNLPDANVYEEAILAELQ